MLPLTSRALAGTTLTAGLLLLGSGAAAAHTYEIVPGDTLSDIAEREDIVDRWQDLVTINDLEDPDLIFPGTVLQLHAHDGAAPAPQSEAAPAPAPQAETAPAPQAETAPEPAPQAETAPEPAPEPEPAPQAETAPEPAPQSETSTSGVDAGTWDRLAQCESGGDWSINTGNGYYGGLQFALSSWEWVGGSGMPHEASREEQINRAEILLDRQGWNAWPACSAELGLR